ncbi:hypothetical protein BDY21DRAFT_278510 [Lineolata rhizophorae]|uniref:Uncharacterized protein n=1 Tax=Lineolata rhizophorae TaxID=578093 RepID=A0A6A6PBD3_9PEZI|nr:hypothetical protein BDY21DRAFT_278510 [Lineolata rhizophorae]
MDAIRRVDTPITAAVIQQIAPSTASCSGAAFPDECATADVAATALGASFTTYDISSAAEQTALLALVLFESGNLQYDRNHWPGVPGQGTRNMQSPAYNLQYATALFPGARAQAAQAQGPAAVLYLLLGDQESFGSAAWFLSTQCGQDVRAALQAGTEQGFAAYLTQCVGTTATEGRLQGWRAARQVLLG